MKKRALFIGRFQPFHRGHLDALKQILEHKDKFDEIIIAIGSAEDEFLPANPLTAGERMEIIDLAIREAGMPKEKFWIIPVRNINEYSLWPHHVIRLCPSFEAVFSGSKIVQTLFRNTDKKIIPLEMRISVSATSVREKVRMEEPLEKHLLPSVIRYLEGIHFRERLMEIS